MATIKEMSDQELRAGIMRCLQRLSGEIPKGIMTNEMISKALREYRQEQGSRNILRLAI